MAGERVARILKSKTELTDKEVESLSDSEGWKLIYSIKSRKESFSIKEDQICFTGFSPNEKKELQMLAKKYNLYVVKSVTRLLKYLCCGENAGPVKIMKAKDQGAIIIDKNGLQNIKISE